MTELPLPLVTVVIPCHNKAATIGRAIESVKMQTLNNLECYVVNDSSTDTSEKIVLALIQNDTRFHYINVTHRNVALTRNAGAALARGLFLCFLDGDDWVEPSFLETCVKPLLEDNSLGITYTSLRQHDRNKTSRISAWPDDFDYDAQLSRHNQIPTCSVIRKTCWDRLGGQRPRYCNPKIGAGTEDAEFYTRAGANGWNAKRVTKEALFNYSRHGLTDDRNYTEMNWLSWHPWVQDKQHPFASVAKPAHHSHPVRQYDEPIISVIVPCGPGHAHMLVDALDSLEAQTFRQWEAIVINDTGAPLDLHAYPYVRVVETEGKKGAGYARNRGIEASRANLFVCLDADDFLQPNALAVFIQAHLDNPDAWIYCDMHISHPDGIIEQYKTEDWNVETLWRKGIAPVTCLYTKPQWLIVNGYDEHNAREDWEFHLRLARAGYCGAHIPEPLFTYRHGTGKRRDEGSIKQEALKLRETYNREELEEMCKGCKQTRREKRTALKSAPIPDNWEKRMEPQEIIHVEYIGESRSDFTFRPKGGGRRTYVFNRDNRNRIRAMLASDAAQVLKFSYFRKVQPPTTQAPSELLQAAPVPVEPTAPVFTLEATVEAPPVPMPEPIPAQPVDILVELPPEPAPVISDSPRPDVEVPDITELRVMELMGRMSDFTKDQWAAMLYDEQHRADGMTPRTSVVKLCEKQMK